MPSMPYCPNCFRTLDDVPQGQPCPGCGGAERCVPLAAKLEATSTMTASIEMKLTKGDFRPWIEKWLMIEHALSALEDSYRDPGIRSIEVELRVDSFFVECFHLWDWLHKNVGKGTPPSLPGVTHADIDAYLKGSATLLLCKDICDTHKHHTRNVGRRTAAIRDVLIGATGAAVTIEVDWGLPSATTIDALALAHDCVASWEAFFAACGITPK